MALPMGPAVVDVMRRRNNRDVVPGNIISFRARQMHRKRDTVFYDPHL